MKYLQNYFLVIILMMLPFKLICQPNILCILVDDLGYGDLSCMGAADMRTPHIDQLASEGMRFNQFYANCTVCSPSRASLLSGRYPDLVGVPGVIRQFEANSWGHMSPEATLIPELLNEQDYHTAIIGKWHLGFESPNTPNDRGFDYFKGFLGDMMDDYWTHLRGGVNWMRENREEIRPSGHATNLFTDWTLEYLEDRAGDKQAFFLYLAYNAPHFPIQPPEEHLKKVLDREPELERKRAENVAFVEHLDAQIGRVLDFLRSSGLLENTLVVFTSDNGGALRYAQSNGTLRGGKQDMFEGGIKVPAFMVWKGVVPPGSQSERLTLLMDLYPTFAEIAGAELTVPLDGVSFLPILRGEEFHEPERTVYWVRREGGGYGGQAYYAARRGDHKILQNTPYEPFQFYNIGNDPYEKSPLPGSDSEIFENLRSDLRKHIQQSGRVPWQN